MNYTKIFLIYSVFITTLLFISCSETVKDTTKNDNKTIKDAYKNNFYIGTALNTNQINEVDSIQKKIIANEFNAITA